MSTPDWSNLTFSYSKTNTILRTVYKDGAWSPVESLTDDNLKLSAFSGCLHYAIECFEGLKAFRGKDGKVRIFRPEENAKRLQRSAAYLGIEAPSVELFVDMCKQVVRDLTEQGVYVFGPYPADEYSEDNLLQNFDISLVVGEKELQDLVQTRTSDMRTRFIAGMPMIMTQTDYPATFEFAEDDLDEPANALRQAAYLAIDISANRISYDEAHESPLPKLYHEKRDDSEKVRFAIPKKKAEE